MDQELYDLCEVLSRELGEANDKIRQAGGKLSGADLEYIDKLTHALKSIKTVIAMEESDSSGYTPDKSYARRRNSMGRYTSGRGYYGNKYSRYSRDGRDYSGDDEMMANLHDLMESAPDERTKQEFKRFIDKIERM